jgi:hypothetical protein
MRIANVILMLVLVMFCRSAAAGAASATGLNPISFGANITDSMINPLDSGQSEQGLRAEASRIMHDIHMMGGRTARWFVSNVWPQYRCSRDPEDQASGDIDPAWYIISRALLESAKAEDIKLVVVLADTADGSFSGMSSNEDKRNQQILLWTEHRASGLGHDGYGVSNSAPCDQSFQNGYYGTVAPQKLFEDINIVEHFISRFAKMGHFLVQFPALGGLELFNEPAFAETHRTTFARSIAKIRREIRQLVPALASVPIYSGIAWWDQAIVQATNEAGDLDEEPYVSLHFYGNFSGATSSLNGAVQFVRKLFPEKALVIAEAGSAVPVRDRTTHLRMIKSLMTEMQSAHVGLWPWGTWFNVSSSSADEKWDFNVRGPGGGAFREYLIDVIREQIYAVPVPVQVVSSDGGQIFEEALSIQQIPATAANINTRLRWRIQLGQEKFLSVSRDGVLRRVAAPFSGLMNPPGATIAIDETITARRWAEVMQTASNWTLSVYSCDAPAGATAAQSIPTPLYVLDYAKDTRSDFGSCGQSWVLKRAIL